MDEQNKDGGVPAPLLNLPAGYTVASATDLTFDPRLAFELAVGVTSASELFKKYGIAEDRAREMIATPGFIQKVKEYREEVTRSGYGFRIRAKIQAEDLLSVSYALVQDPFTPATVKADLIKWTAKMADLEPAPKNEKGAGGGGGAVQFNVSFYGASAPEVHVVQPAPAIDVEAV